MATEAILQDISVQVGADLSTKQFFGVKINSSGVLVLAGAGEQAYVLQNKPDNVRQTTGNIAIGGKSKVVLGGTVAAGDFAAVDAAGKFIKAVAANLANVDAAGGSGTEPVKGSHIVGQFTSGGAADEIVDLLILNLGLIPGTVQ